MSDLVLETRPCPIATVVRFKMREISRMQAAGEGRYLIIYFIAGESRVLFPVICYYNEANGTLKNV